MCPVTSLPGLHFGDRGRQSLPVALALALRTLGCGASQVRPGLFLGSFPVSVASLSQDTLQSLQSLLYLAYVLGFLWERRLCKQHRSNYLMNNYSQEITFKKLILLGEG